MIESFENNCNTFDATSGLLGTAKSVVRSTAFDGDSRGPSIQSVLDVLSLNGIEIESKIMQVSISLIFQICTVDCGQQIFNALLFAESTAAAR